MLVLDRAAGRTIGAKSIANDPRVYLSFRSNGWDAKSWRPFSFYKKEVSHLSGTCIPATLSSKTVSPGIYNIHYPNYIYAIASHLSADDIPPKWADVCPYLRTLKLIVLQKSVETTRKKKKKKKVYV